MREIHVICHFREKYYLIFNVSRRAYSHCYCGTYCLRLIMITFCGFFNSWTHIWSDRAFKTPKSLFKIFLLITKQQVTFCSSWITQTIKCYLVWLPLIPIWHLYVIYSLASFLNIKIIRKTQLDRSHIRKNTFKVNVVKLWVQQRKKKDS